MLFGWFVRLICRGGGSGRARLVFFEMVSASVCGADSFSLSSAMMTFSLFRFFDLAATDGIAPMRLESGTIFEVCGIAGSG